MFNFSKPKPDNFFTKAKKGLCKLGRMLGPGFLTGAADDDPSGIGTYSMAGAKYGLKMAWLVPFQLPLMFAIQEMSARIGLKTRRGLAANMKQFFPKFIVYPAIFILVFANVVNIGADIAIMAASTHMMLGVNIQLWAVVITLGIILLQVFVSYHLYSRLLLWTAVFLLAYVITAFMVTQSWLEVLKFSFTPHMIFNADFILVATGFIGTTISPYLFFWQASQEVEELNDKKSHQIAEISSASLIKKMRLDTFIGMFFSQLIALFILVTCFYSLHLHGITEINTAADAAMALRPLAGDWAYLLFTVGIVGSGLLGIPVLAGSTAYALVELTNYRGSLADTYKEAPFFYGVIIISTLLGLCMTFVMTNPVQALLYAAVVNGIVAVPFIFFIIVLANKKEVMEEHKNKYLANLGGGITLGLMLASVVIFVVMFPW